MPETAVALAAGVAGVAAGAAVAAALYERALRRTARACSGMRSGDLSATLPEEGPAPLRALARAFNDLEADFQEVLLLFAHSIRSARESAELLRDHLVNVDDTWTRNGRSAAEILADIDQMQSMVQDFKYFRVTIEGGTIRDTGIVPAAPPAPAPQETGDGR